MPSDDVEYDSGPFCRHWHDPADCDVKCVRCGHACMEHSFDEPYYCDECDCKGWEEADDAK